MSATHKLHPNDPRHGTPTGYKHWKCRCVPCRKANHAKVKVYAEGRPKRRSFRGDTPENLTPLPGEPYDFSEMIPSCDGNNHYSYDNDA